MSRKLEVEELRSLAAYGTLTPSVPAVPNCCCSKGQAPYWSNPPFLVFDIRALWRLVLSARAPECQIIKMVGYTSMAKCKALTASAVKGLNTVRISTRFSINYTVSQKSSHL